MPPLTVWVLTGGSGEPLRQVIERDYPAVQVLGRQELFERYGQEQPEGVRGFAEPHDLWHSPVFLACLRRAQERGELPDLLDHGSTWTIALVDEFLCDLTPFVISDEVDIVSTFINRARLSCRPEEGQPNADCYFALPFTVDCRAMFYRPPLREADLRNWHTFSTRMRELKPRGVRVALQMGVWAFQEALPWIWAAGGDIVRASDLRVLVDSPETVEAVMRLVTLAMEGMATIDAPILDPEDAQAALHDERVRAGLETYWLYRWLPPSYQIAATLPPGDRFRATFIGGTNLGIVRKHGPAVISPAYDAARELLAYLCLDHYVMDRYELRSLEETPASRYTQAVGAVPPQVSIWQQWQRHDSRADTFSHALLGPDHLRCPSIAQMAGIEYYMKLCFERLWTDVRVVHARGGSLEECRPVVERRLQRARRYLERQLRGRVGVRYRPAGGPRFHPEEVLWRSDLPRRYPLAATNLFVDEERNRCWITLGNGTHEISLGSMRPQVRQLFLELLRSEDASLPAPQVSFGDLTRLEQLIHDLRQLRLMWQFDGKRPREEIEAEIQAKLADLSGSIFDLAAVRKKHRSLSKTVSDLRRALGQNADRLLPTRRGTPLNQVALATDLSVCHVRAARVERST